MRGSCIYYLRGVHVFTRISCIYKGSVYLQGVRVFTRGSCIYEGFVYCSLFVGCTCNQAKQGVGLEHRYLHRKGMLGLVSSVGSFCHSVFHCDIRPLTVPLGWFGTCSIAICETERLATK